MPLQMTVYAVHQQGVFASCLEVSKRPSCTCSSTSIPQYYVAGIAKGIGGFHICLVLHYLQAMARELALGFPVRGTCHSTRDRETSQERIPQRHPNMIIFPG